MGSLQVGTIFEDIVAMLMGKFGGERHTSLLRQMTVEMGKLCPAVIEINTRQCLDEFRGFRHIVRHVYTFNLRPARLAELVHDAPNCLANLTADLLAFADFLEKTA
jgi:hypothetical protein